MIEFWHGKMPGEVIITPVGTLLKLVAGKLSERKNISKSPWWPAVTGFYGGSKICIIDCGRGSSAGDCVLFLSRKNVKKITFAGFAGSLNANFSPGDVCCLKAYGGGAGFAEFISADFSKDLPLALPKKFRDKTPKIKKASVYTIPSIFRESEIFGTLAKKGFDLVDMETAHVITAAKGRIELSFLYYITDYRQHFEKINLDKLEKLCLR